MRDGTLFNDINSSRNINSVHDSCTACFACVEVCPVKCIHMEEDGEGFLYPKAHENLCKSCGNCMKKCHVLSPVILKEYERTAFWGRIKEEALFKNSSSGGGFSAIVSAMKEKKPVIFGACLNKEDFYVSHEEREGNNYQDLCKSKYVISDMRGIYPKVKEGLNKNRYVLFAGTPCQVGGLKAYLGKEYERLITIDFICHGVPSAQILKEHLKYIEESRGKKIESLDFRSKKLGWRKHCLYIKFKDGTTYLKDLKHDYYLDLFMKYYDLRLSCYHCAYSNKKHQSEITLADFWGINKHKIEADNDTGISLLVANNEKGFKMTEELCRDKALMDMSLVPEDKYKYIYKEHTYYPVHSRQKFFEDYKTLGYKKMAKKFKQNLFVEEHLRGVIRVFKKIGRMLKPEGIQKREGQPDLKEGS